MSRRDDSSRLRHMLDHATEAVQMAAGHTQNELKSNRQLCLALTRLLEIVGEAAARTAPSTRNSIPGVPWPEMIGLRNRLIHGYDEVDLDIMWDTITRDLPNLIATLQKNLDPI